MTQIPNNYRRQNENCSEKWHKQKRKVLLPWSEWLVAGWMCELCTFPGCGERFPTSVPGRGERGREALSNAARRDRETSKSRAARRREETEARSFAQRCSACRTVPAHGGRPSGPTECQYSHFTRATIIMSSSFRLFYWIIKQLVLFAHLQLDSRID